ncbi:MAG: hypothetical protein P8Y45_09440 [Exilibacterium sp.]
MEPEGSPKLVFKGLENVRSDWILLAKKFHQSVNYEGILAAAD